jgi:hypothetical protein
MHERESKKMATPATGDNVQEKEKKGFGTGKLAGGLDILMALLTATQTIKPLPVILILAGVAVGTVGLFRKDMKSRIIMTVCGYGWTVFWLLIMRSN